MASFLVGNYLSAGRMWLVCRWVMKSLQVGCDKSAGRMSMWQVCRMDVTSLQIRCANSVCSMWSLHTKIHVSAFKIPLLTVWYPTSLLRRAIFPLLLWMLGIDSISCSFSLYLSDFFQRVFFRCFFKFGIVEKKFSFYSLDHFTK